LSEHPEQNEAILKRNANPKKKNHNILVKESALEMSFSHIKTTILLKNEENVLTTFGDEIAFICKQSSSSGTRCISGIW